MCPVTSSGANEEIVAVTLRSTRTYNMKVDHDFIQFKVNINIKI